MKKHFTAAVAVFAAFSMTLTVGATEYGEPEAAAEASTEAISTDIVAETVAVTVETPAEEDEPAVDGVRIYLDGTLMELSAPAVLVDSMTYVPLRSFCAAMGASSITWNADTLTVCVDAGNFTIEATHDSRYIIANGRCLYVPSGNLVIDGVFMAPVRALASAFGAEIAWDGESGSVHITSGSGAILSGDEFYDADNLKWLAHIINAESRGECLEGKIAVGNVVLNRVESDYYPDTVYDVVFDGIQFTPALTGAIYAEPSAESWIAAKLALEGADVVGDSLFFAQSSLYCWAARNRTLSATIGGHSFYL